MATRFSSFAEFYPFYLEQHANRTCRVLHFIGTWLVVAVAVFAFVRDEAVWLWLMPLLGYGFAWIGHFFFEHNRPATFRHPFYSLLGDFVMWKDIMAGKVKL
jgi:hypothetical protein